MTITDTEIQQRLRLGEDSVCEFKQVEFRGNCPRSPRRNELADEMTAFANANGGILLCGVTDDGEIQGMSQKQLDAVDRLLVEISTDMVKPPLRITVYHREINGQAFIHAEVPRGDTVHERDGQAMIRVGASKRHLNSDEKLKLSQNRAQSRYLWPDRQIVRDTGFETFNERLWEPLLSATGARDARTGLVNLGLLAEDETGVLRATVAGILLCTSSPQEWLPQATIMATYYRGRDRASGQLDTQEIVGPLQLQITEAVKFVIRNMRVAARKLPDRVDVPQYSPAAVFEAVVNAVVHRDYSGSSRKIRISMFKGRLEIDSPGQLPNGMTIDGMESSQATRNEAIAAVFGRIPVGDGLGANHRRFLMERRGDGVSIIKSQTQETSGNLPQYRLVDGSNVVLEIPAAKLELSPASSSVTVHSGGEPLYEAEVLALFPNKTWQKATTDEAGEATLDLYTTNLPMTVYVAALGYSGGLKRQWLPNQGGLLIELNPLLSGGSIIFPESTGHIPGLRGRLNPKLDTSNRTYLYATNISIEDGRQQPVPFRFGKPMKLTDAFGRELSVTIVDMIGKSALLEYRSVTVNNEGDT